MTVNDCSCSSVGALPERNSKRQVRNDNGHAGFTDIPSWKVEICLDDGKNAIEEGDGDLGAILLAYSVSKKTLYFIEHVTYCD